MTTSRLIALFVPLLTLLVSGCATKPPANQDNICHIFEHNPRWYDHAKRSEDRWGTPIPVQIAFVQQESSFRHNVRPPRDYLLGVIPKPRRSSAYGYAQAQSPAWSDYRKATGHSTARRSNMAHSLDFIGWYNDVSHRRLNIPKHDAHRLYLAYHEGHGGYSRGTYRAKPQVMRVASRVDQRAQRYSSQLAGCERDFRCRRFYQFWPFCR
ncbi:hypothetical protein HUS23_06470 [Ectothiorhodospiraceae bacterium 2226]|nr:hypothetical protein HUS23_06470 [Ectothiorhodospiraceae bacterium 2226]